MPTSNKENLDYPKRHMVIVAFTPEELEEFRMKNGKRDTKKINKVLSANGIDPTKGVVSGSKLGSPLFFYTQIKDGHV